MIGVGPAGSVCEYIVHYKLLKKEKFYWKGMSSGRLVYFSITFFLQSTTKMAEWGYLKDFSKYIHLAPSKLYIYIYI